MSGPVTEALAAYFRACPLAPGGLQLLPAAPAAGEEPEETVLRRYFRGSLRQCTFALRPAEGCTPGALAGWLRRQTRQRRLPALPRGTAPQSLAVCREPFSAAGQAAGNAPVRCRLVYFQTEQEDVNNERF